MTLVSLRVAPRSFNEREKFHFNHYLDHKIILGVVSKKVGRPLLMPPIWPVPGGNFDPKIAEFHQLLHQQMNAISGTNSSDMTQVDLSTPEGWQAFLEPNYRDHYAFHELVGIPT